MRDSVTIRYAWRESDELRLSFEVQGKVEEVTLSSRQLVEGLPLVQLDPSPFKLADAQVREMELSDAYVYLKLQEPHGRASVLEILREGINTLVYVNQRLVHHFKPPL